MAIQSRSPSRVQDSLGKPCIYQRGNESIIGEVAYAGNAETEKSRGGHHKKRIGKLCSASEVSDAIIQEHPIHFSYTRQDGRTKERTVKPLAVIFSEFYFYLIGLQIYETEDAFRTYRLDRMKAVTTSDEKFNVPYRDKFRDGEFRKRVQFMYDGDLMRVKFRYFGVSIEHVLDRLPTAKAKKRDVGVYDVIAEVYGDGILIWLLSQGSQVDVIAPQDLRNEWLSVAEQIVNRDYNGWEDVDWKGDV